jgi:ribonucleoside-diphosphate reductase alpha chain
MEERNDERVELSENARKVLEKRYLKKDDTGKVAETPYEMFHRVASNIASADRYYGKSDEDIARVEQEFFDMMAGLEFLPNSPTLMNAGRDLQQLSACFVLSIDDSMESIFETIKDTAIIHKSGGGTGFSFSRLRPKNSPVRSTGGISSGPVSFMKVFNSATQAVKQGGTRRGANMGILRVDHPDILEFITCKESDKEITNFNISVAVTEDFIKKAINGEEYDLIDPHTKKPVQKLNARKVLDLIIRMAWKNGEPGIVFIDRINRDNPTPKVGAIESTNPCVTGDSFVSTEFGLMRMRDLARKFPDGGIAVLTDDRILEMKYSSASTRDSSAATLVKQGVGFSTISRAWRTGVKETLKMTTRSGYELIATPDHKVMTTDGWVMMKDLKAGVHNIMIQSGEGRFNTKRDIPFEVKNIFEGINGRAYRLNMPDKWSRQLGQAMGYMVGDGWLRDGDGDCRVGLTFSKDDENILTYIKYIMNSFYGADIKEVKRNNGVYHLSYHSKYFVDFFKRLGIKAWQSDEKEVPESIFMATEDAVKGFLQGLFTADGTVRDNPRSNSAWVALTSKSESLLKQVQVLLLNLGIKSMIFDRSRLPREGLFSYLTKGGELKSYSSDGILYELGIFGENRERFRLNIGFLDEKKTKRLNDVRFKNFHERIFEEKIASIETAGVKEVYDLTEPFTHSMIVNGIVIHQCGEQPLLPYESCNLGSINLAKMVLDGEIDWIKLGSTVEKAVHFLDNVIDMNSYPLKRIEDMTKSNRKVGLGVMGFADMLIMLGVDYDSEDAIRLAEKVMKFILDSSINASENLADERGAFPNFQQSIYNTSSSRPLRNATLTTIAPTGTLSIIANCSSGIEPIFAISYIRNILDNTKFVEVHPYFKEVAEKRSFYSAPLMSQIAEKGSIRGLDEVPEDIQKLFVTAHDIEPIWHIKMQAAFQKYTNNAVSKTVNLPSDATVDDVFNIYMQAYESGCKGVTIYRDKSREEQVLNKPGTPEPAETKVSQETKIVPRPRPNVIIGTTTKIATGCGNLYVTINVDENGLPFELFTSMGKAGGCAMSQLEAIGRLVSLAFRSGIDTNSIIEQLRGIRCPSPSWEKGGRIFSCSDAIARVIERRMQDEKAKTSQDSSHISAESAGGTVKIAKTKVGSIVGVCPDCGSALWHVEGCMICKSCGYSKCG